MDTLYVNNDHVLQLRGLRDAGGALITGAAAEATLYEADGTTEVAGITWPLSLTSTASPGAYEAPLSSAVSLEPCGRYKLKLRATYIGQVYEATRTVTAEIRNE